MSSEVSSSTEVDKSTSDLHEVLLGEIKRRWPEIEKLLKEIEDDWGIEDGMYRFYHQSFKVYAVAGMTEQIVNLLKELMPGRALSPWFLQIVGEGTGKKFHMSHNKNWLKHTRPIVEAFFHAHYFLRMIRKYGRELEAAPTMLPSGWAAVLHLYRIR